MLEQQNAENLANTSAVTDDGQLLIDEETVDSNAEMQEDFEDDDFELESIEDMEMPDFLQGEEVDKIG